MEVVPVKFVWRLQKKSPGFSDPVVSRFYLANWSVPFGDSTDRNVILGSCSVYSGPLQIPLGWVSKTTKRWSWPLLGTRRRVFLSRGSVVLFFVYGSKRDQRRKEGRLSAVAQNFAWGVRRIKRQEQLHKCFVGIHTVQDPCHVFRRCWVACDTCFTSSLRSSAC